VVELEGQDDRIGAQREDTGSGTHGDPGKDDTSERVLVEELLPAHGLIPPLTASDHDRYAYVIAGRLGAYVGHTVTAGPGSIVSIPRGAAAAIWNALPRDCSQTDLVATVPPTGGARMPLAIEPAACGPDTRIAVLHVWELKAGSPRPILAL
jgi:hypothetical protein